MPRSAAAIERRTELGKESSYEVGAGPGPAPSEGGGQKTPGAGRKVWGAPGGSVVGTVTGYVGGPAGGRPHCQAVGINRRVTD